MRIGLHTLCFVVAFASAVSAQRTYINHGTYPADFASISPGEPVADRPGYVWRHDGKGWYWELIGTPTPSPTPSTPTECSPWPSPYTERDRFLACMATRHEPPTDDDSAPVTTYHVGMRYWMGYPSLKMIVLAVALGVDGTPHVLAQWLTDGAQHKAGDTFTFPANEHQPWMRYHGEGR